MNILTVGYLQGYGGAERQIILLSNQLALRGHSVTLCILAHNNSSFIINEDVNVVDLSEDEGLGKLKAFKRFLLFKNTVHRIKPDVIINYNLQSAFFCLGISKKSRGFVVYSERGDPYDKEYSGIMGIIRDYTVKRMNGLVFQSEGARDFFNEEVKCKSIVIHNSVNIPQNQFPIPIVRDKRIVTVGRLHPQKNQRLLIGAFALIAYDFPDYILEIYGDGPLSSELNLYIEELNLNNRVSIYASRKDIFDCIYKASLFVLSSDYEGLPNALMEAMALGLPCISTDCRPGGAKSLIESGINGIIVPSGDKTSLAEAIKDLLSNHDKAERLARQAKNIVISHSEEIVFGKWNSFLSMRFQSNISK